LYLQNLPAYTGSIADFPLLTSVPGFLTLSALPIVDGVADGFLDLNPGTFTMDDCNLVTELAEGVVALQNVIVQNCDDLSSINLSSVITCADLTFTANPILNSVDLGSLEESGNITIAGVGLNLASIDTPVLQTVSGTISISVANWTLDFPALLSVVGFSVSNCAAGTTSIAIPLVTSANSINIDNCPGLVTFDMSALVSVTGSLVLQDLPLFTPLDLTALTECPDINISNCDSLTAVAMNALSTGPSTLAINGNALLATISAALVSGIDNLYIQNNPALTAIDLSACTSLSTDAVITGNDVLTSITFSGGFAPANNGQTFNFSGNALDEPTVDAILAGCVAGAWSQGTIDLSAGTNAPPSATGAADAATLAGNGVSVATN
jgi:hypothetical protein